MTSAEDGGWDRGRGGKDARSLGFVVAGEAKRVLSEAQIAADPARIAAGWERRFLVDVVRAPAMLSLYRELGFEAVADPVSPQQLRGDCGECQLLMQLQFKMIYTRKTQR